MTITLTRRGRIVATLLTTVALAVLVAWMLAYAASGGTSSLPAEQQRVIDDLASACGVDPGAVSPADSWDVSGTVYNVAWTDPDGYTDASSLIYDANDPTRLVGSMC